MLEKDIFHKFFHLSGQEKKLFIEAWIFLGWYRFLIRAISFKKIANSSPSHPFTVRQSIGIAVQSALIELVANAISRAAKFTPWESACLVQALVARRMLYKRQVGGVFYLGIKNKVEQEKPTLVAHAWSKCGNLFITGERGHKEYRVITSYPWEGL